MIIRLVILISFFAFQPSGVSLAQSGLKPGQRLALEMRQTPLLNYETISGRLQTRGRRGARSNQTLTLQTQVEGGQWRSVFRAINASTGLETELAIHRSPDQRPRYFVTKRTTNSGGSEQNHELSEAQAMAPFAGSDFWATDLGLDFFYWPGQVLATNARIKMRKGISCFVLDSIRPATKETTGYTRVRSWISRDHGGLIYAEAYSRSGQHLKTFEVSDVEKIDGEWKLKALKIRDESSRSTTRLVFDNF